MEIEWNIPRVIGDWAVPTANAAASICGCSMCPPWQGSPRRQHHQQCLWELASSAPAAAAGSTYALRVLANFVPIADAASGFWRHQSPMPEVILIQPLGPPLIPSPRSPSCHTSILLINPWPPNCTPPSPHPHPIGPSTLGSLPCCPISLSRGNGSTRDVIGIVWMNKGWKAKDEILANLSQWEPQWGWDFTHVVQKKSCNLH